MDNLFAQLDGREVETAAEQNNSHNKCRVRVTEMTTIQKLLDIISDPNFAYILLMLGIYGLLLSYLIRVQFCRVLSGYISYSCILLFSLLPINFAFRSYHIFCSPFIAEIKIVSHGLLAAGGIISFLSVHLCLSRQQSLLRLFKSH